MCVLDTVVSVLENDIHRLEVMKIIIISSKCTYVQDSTLSLPGNPIMPEFARATTSASNFDYCVL